MKFNNYTKGIDYAKEICSWKYEGEYSIYNFSDYDVVILVLQLGNYLAG